LIRPDKRLKGATSVVGVDFAPSMIELATTLAGQTGVADRCRFEQKDFMDFSSDQKSDYTVAIGFMDYMSDPRAVIQKILTLTTSKAFFSFPVAGGILGWQRKLRYRSRCELYLYTQSQLDELFDEAPCSRYEIEQIDRDFFVTAYA
jgi:ubiquinone/menaquinone biosynthesis C-methylase UbiE